MLQNSQWVNARSNVSLSVLDSKFESRWLSDATGRVYFVLVSGGVSRRAMYSYGARWGRVRVDERLFGAGRDVAGVWELGIIRTG